MGFPSDLFVSEPDEHFLCVICHDVFEDPCSVPCGHTFCRACLTQWFRSSGDGNGNGNGRNVCPTCRKPNPRKIMTPLLSMRGLIGGLLVHCRNGNLNDSNGGCCGGILTDNGLQAARSRRRIAAESHDGIMGGHGRGNDEENDDGTGGGCLWTGKLRDRARHLREECMWRVIECSVPGCRHRCARRDMAAHQATAVTVHMTLLLNERVSRAAAKLEAQMEAKMQAAAGLMRADLADQLHLVHQHFESELGTKDDLHRQEVLHLHLTQFCRQWILYQRHLPALLWDFVVYRPKTSHCRGGGGIRSTQTGASTSSFSTTTTSTAAGASTSPSITRLLVGIPGPDGTPWQGGLFPVLMTWRSMHEAPTCVFPVGFHHVNVFPAGNILLSAVYEEMGWHAEITIPEMLVSFQRLLAHPNLDWPASTEAYQCYLQRQCVYKARARMAAAKYSPESFLQVALESAAFGEEDIGGGWVQLLDDEDGNLSHAWWAEPRVWSSCAKTDSVLPEAIGQEGGSKLAASAEGKSREDRTFESSIAAPPNTPRPPYSAPAGCGKEGEDPAEVLSKKASKKQCTSVEAGSALDAAVTAASAFSKALSPYHVGDRSPQLNMKRQQDSLLEASSLPLGQQIDKSPLPPPPNAACKAPPKKKRRNEKKDKERIVAAAGVAAVAMGDDYDVDDGEPGGQCSCSSCEQGPLFWNRRREIRFLFGIPG